MWIGLIYRINQVEDMDIKYLFAFSIACFLTSFTHANPILSNVSSAENSLITSNNRLFISGDGQFTEAVKTNGAWQKIAIPAYLKNGVKTTCDFLGITELKERSKVYTVCADSVYNPLSTKRLFVLDLNTTVSELHEVGQIQNASLINGVTDDEQNNIYVADSAVLGAGKILKLSLTSNGFTQTTLHQYLLDKPNGLKYDNGHLYATLDAISLLGLTRVVRYDLLNNGIRNERTIFSRISFFDDFNLVNGGIVVADFLAGKVYHVRESDGQLLNQAIVVSPSSVSIGTDPLLNQGDLVVTGKLTGTVIQLQNNWGLQPR